MKGPQAKSQLPGNMDPGRGGAVHPIMAHMGRLRPKGVPFSERAGILLIEVYERVGKSVIWVSERAQRAEQMNFMALQSRENLLFLQLIPI